MSKGHAVFLLAGFTDSGHRFRTLLHSLLKKNQKYHFVEIHIDAEGRIATPYTIKEYAFYIIQHSHINTSEPVVWQTSLQRIINDPRFDGCQIDMIGHSFGGAVMYDYITREHARTVRKLVAISVPFAGGISWSKLFLRLLFAKEHVNSALYHVLMSKDDEQYLYRLLTKRRQPETVELYSLIGRFDTAVTRRSAAGNHQLKLAEPQTVISQKAGSILKGHLEVMENPVLINKIQSILFDTEGVR